MYLTPSPSIDQINRIQLVHHATFHPSMSYPSFRSDTNNWPEWFDTVHMWILYSHLCEHGLSVLCQHISYTYDAYLCTYVCNVYLVSVHSLYIRMSSVIYLWSGCMATTTKFLKTQYTIASYVTLAMSICTT